MAADNVRFYGYELSWERPRGQVSQMEAGVEGGLTGELKEKKI